jgi:hypothetical protein
MDDISCKGYRKIMAAKISQPTHICFFTNVEVSCLYFEQIEGGYKQKSCSTPGNITGLMSQGYQYYLLKHF